MKKLILIIFLLHFLFLYGEDYKFEKGDGIYIRGLSIITFFLGHTGIYKNWRGEYPEEYNKHVTIEAIGGPPWTWKYTGPTITNFEKFLEGRGDYWGAYTLPDIDQEQRQTIIEIAEYQATRKPRVQYHFFGGYKRPNKSFRCDGLVEYCYEVAYGEPWKPGRNGGIVKNDRWFTLSPLRQMLHMVSENPELKEVCFHKEGKIEEGEAIIPSKYKDGKYYISVPSVTIKFYATDGEKGLGQGSGLTRGELWIGRPDDTPYEFPGKRIFRDDTDYETECVYTTSFNTTDLKPGEYELFAKAFDQAGNYKEVSIPIVIRKGGIFKDKDNWDGQQIWHGSGTYWDAGTYIRSNSNYYGEDRGQVGEIGNGYLYPEFVGEPVKNWFGNNENFIRCIRNPIIGYDEYGFPIYDPVWLDIIQNSGTPFEDSYRYLLNKTPKFWRGLPYEIGNGYIVSDAAGQFYTGNMWYGSPGNEVLTTRHFLQFPVKEDKAIFKVESGHKGCSSYGNTDYQPFYVGVGVFNSNINIATEEEGKEDGGLKELFYQAENNTMWIFPADGYGEEKDIFRHLEEQPEILQRLNKKMPDEEKYIYISVMKAPGGNSLSDMEDLSHGEAKSKDKWGEFCRYGRQNHVDVASAFISNGWWLKLYYSRKSYWISPFFNISPDEREDDKIIISGVDKEGVVKLYIRFKESGESSIDVEDEYSEYREGWIELGELEDKEIDGELLGYPEWERFQICLEFWQEGSEVNKFEVEINEK